MKFDKLTNTMVINITGKSLSLSILYQAELIIISFAVKP